jgi:glycine cleavage system H protein
MNFPSNLKYTKDHEWARIDGNHLVVGITEHAQNALGDIVFCELPVVGRTLKAGETFGVVESIKAVSDLYSPVAGKVISTNTELTQDPAAINRDPYGVAWMVELELSPGTELSSLMDAEAYARYVKSLS